MTSFKKKDKQKGVDQYLPTGSLQTAGREDALQTQPNPTFNSLGLTTLQNIESSIAQVNSKLDKLTETLTPGKQDYCARTAECSCGSCSSKPGSSGTAVDAGQYGAGQQSRKDGECFKSKYPGPWTATKRGGGDDPIACVSNWTPVLLGFDVEEDPICIDRCYRIKSKPKEGNQGRAGPTSVLTVSDSRDRDHILKVGKEKGKLYYKEQEVVFFPDYSRETEQKRRNLNIKTTFIARGALQPEKLRVSWNRQDYIFWDPVDAEKMLQKIALMCLKPQNISAICVWFFFVTVIIPWVVVYY